MAIGNDTGQANFHPAEVEEITLKESESINFLEKMDQQEVFVKFIQFLEGTEGDRRKMPLRGEKLACPIFSPGGFFPPFLVKTIISGD